MPTDLGELLRRERQAKGWDQADLARELGDVTQQTVSRWERGGSRPRRSLVVKVASLLELDAGELLAAAGYGSPSDEAAEVRNPVRPRVTVLPVAELSPDKFEELVADVARRIHPEARVSRFGGPGHTQYGFDVVAQADSRFVAAYQCKRRERFGPADVRAAVSAATLEVDRAFLVLTRIASPDCRTEMVRHAGWTLWDAEDLAREIRALPLDEGVRVVDTYFPGWREAFLGVPEPGPWLQPDEFFSPLASSGIYTHAWDLVGREKQLAGLLKFLDDDDRIAAVVGRGGIGKTRLLRELADRAAASGWSVRFVTTGVEVNPADLELLPSAGPLLVIVDDAHDRSDLTPLIRALALRNSDCRVVLALRPYGMPMLASDLRPLGVHPTEIPQWILDDLTIEEAETLARQALGATASEPSVQRLAGLTLDCPLITVVAGVLIERGELSVACLDHEDSIRSEVLRAFRDVLVADPITGETTVRRAVLDATSILQPVRSDEPTFQAALAALVGVPYHSAITHLRSLEDAGVLLRHGSTLRVVPDLLGDVILADACFDDRAGASTGYVERAIAVSEAAPFQNIFVNVSRIDWQIRHDNAEASSLTDSLWSQIDTAFDAAGILGRRHLAALLRKVAAFAPVQTLVLVRRAIDFPTHIVEDVDGIQAALVRLSPPTYDDVLRELPPLLRSIGYHLEYLPESLDILWELGRRDERPTNQHPDHALRVLVDLAELEIGKPLVFNMAVIDAAERWLKERPNDAGPSPFDPLDAMLATEGSEHQQRGYSLIFKPFALTPESVAPLRTRILDLAFNEVASADLGVAVRAVGTIETGLRYPHGLFGRVVDETERDAWTPEFVATLDRLATVVSDPALDPVVAIAIRRAIRWHAEHSPTETRNSAERVHEALQERTQDQLAVALFDGWGELSERLGQDFEQAQLAREARTKAVAESLVKSNSDAEIQQRLEDRLGAQRALGRSGSAGPFVWTLVSARPSIGTAIARSVAASPSSPLIDVLAIAVAAVCESLPTEAEPTIAMLLDSGDLQLRRQVAQALGWNRGQRSALVAGEERVLAQLAVDPDEFIRTCVARAAQRIAIASPDEGARLLAQVRFADSAAVADEVFQAFGPHGELDWRRLSPTMLSNLLDELEHCPSVENYWINAFLADLSRERPAETIEFLQRRIDRWELADASVDYQALPFHWDNPLQIREGDRFEPLLRSIRQWIASSPESWHRQEGGGDLFASVAGAFDDAVIEVIEEGANTGDPSDMGAVAAIVRKAPRRFVYENVGLVRQLLALAASLGAEHAENIAGAVSASAISGSRWGTPGEPFAEDIEQRDRARAIADRLPSGSPEERLYRSLEASAQRSIQWVSDREDRMDGRDW